MILVTVGTSLPFDKLIEEVDTLIALDDIIEPVYMQIGNGKYIPKFCTQYRRFVNNMKEAYNKANLVISACGAGTIMECTTLGIKLIVVQNPDITGGHEWELISKMESLEHLIWCKDIGDLLRCIEDAKKKELKPYIPDLFNIEIFKKLIDK